MIPAMTSVRTFVPCSQSLKKSSSMSVLTVVWLAPPGGRSGRCSRRVLAALGAVCPPGRGRCMISAATKAAITSGRLSGRPAAPIGQTSAAVSGRVPSARAEPALERHPLGARADHADIGRVAARQRLAHDQEVERMVVGQDHERGAGRARGARLLRQRRQPRLEPAAASAPVPRRAGRPAPAAPAAAPAPPPAPGRRGRRRRSCTSGSARRSASAAARRRSHPPASRRAHRQHGAPAAALADLRPERNVERRGSLSPRASIARAASIAMYSSWPPPMVPIGAARPHHHPGAALARRRAARLLDAHQRRGALVAAEVVDRLRPDRHGASRRSRSTAISTRSGVAGASSRGHSR